MNEPVTLDSLLGAVFIMPLLFGVICICFIIYYFVKRLKYYKTAKQVVIHIAVAFFKIAVISAGFVFSISICDVVFYESVLLKSTVVISICAVMCLSLASYALYEDNVHESMWLFDYIDKITSDEKKELLNYMEFLTGYKNKK